MNFFRQHTFKLSLSNKVCTLFDNLTPKHIGSRVGGQTAFFLAFCRPADPESSAANDREFMVVKEKAGEVMGTMLNFPCNQKKGIQRQFAA